MTNPNESIKLNKHYKTPQGTTKEEFDNLIYEFIDFINTNHLTTQQIQYLFDMCKDCVLEINTFTLDNKYNMPCWKPDKDLLEHIKSVPFSQ